MSQGYSIWVVSPHGYSHSRCFDEIALSLREAFAELGEDAPVVSHPSLARGRTIVLGANLLRLGDPMPADCILYNLEQVSRGSTWWKPGYLDLLNQRRVWDYSRQNIGALAALGVRADLCEIGYMPALSRIPAAPEQDIDVALIGSMNDRRQAVLEALRGAGKNVFAGFNLYGEERDAIYARAKIVINIHFYESKVFEIVRCSYLLANRLCVVSEAGSDSDIEDAYRSGIAFAPYDQLIATCLRLLDDNVERQRLAEAGFAAFAARPQTAFLRDALNATAAA